MKRAALIGVLAGVLFWAGSMWGGTTCRDEQPRILKPAKVLI